MHSPQLLRTSLLSMAIALGVASPAAAQRTAQNVYRDLAEVKAECQRLAKLQVELALRPDSDRASRRFDRAQAELSTYIKYASDWSAFTQVPSGQLVADIKAVLALADRSPRDREAIPQMLSLSERCSTDADALLSKVQGVGGKAIGRVSRLMLLTQRSVRDFLIVNAGQKIPGVSYEKMDTERNEIDSLLKEIAQLPSTPGMKSALDLTTNQWALLRPMLVKRSASVDNQDIAMRSSERMFDAVDELFEQVQKAATAFN